MRERTRIISIEIVFPNNNHSPIAVVTTAQFLNAFIVGIERYFKLFD